MNNLYHITPKHNLPSIVVNGLIPKFKSNRFSVCGSQLRRIDNKQLDVIWLTDNPNWIVENQLGKDNYDEHDFCILEVDVSNLKIKKINDHEFTFSNSIRFDRINISTGLK
jgi:hypothetical protein